MKTLISIAICGLILAGCAAKPLTTGDSTVQLKTASFPKQGQQTHTVVGGLVHLKANYQSGFTFRLVNSLSMDFWPGKIIVSTEEKLFQSSLSDENVFCTSNKVYYAPYSGPTTKACFRSDEKGRFNSIKLQPSAILFDKQLLPSVEFIAGAETAFSIGGQPLKRELIFEGGEDGTLMFSEKIYENSVEIASRSKPLMFKVESIPSKAILNGAEITIINYTNNTLTYSLEKAWN